jgi:hypothetical protein
VQGTNHTAGLGIGMRLDGDRDNLNNFDLQFFRKICLSKTPSSPQGIARFVNSSSSPPARIAVPFQPRLIIVICPCSSPMF